MECVRGRIRGLTIWTAATGVLWGILALDVLKSLENGNLLGVLLDFMVGFGGFAFIFYYYSRLSSIIGEVERELVERRKRAEDANISCK